MGARTAEDSGWRELAVKKEKGKDRTGIGVGGGGGVGALGPEEDSGVLAYYFPPRCLETGPLIESTAIGVRLG